MLSPLKLCESHTRQSELIRPIIALAAAFNPSLYMKKLALACKFGTATCQTHLLSQVMPLTACRTSLDLGREIALGRLQGRQDSTLVNATVWAMLP